MEIRRVTNDERLSTITPLRAYAFAPSPASAADLAAFADGDRYRSGDISLVAQDGSRTLATAAAIPMRQNIRGTVYPMAGIAGVASDPLARRQGHVRALLNQLLGEMRDAGHPVSALYPFRPSFYERFGYLGLPQARTVTFAPAGLGPLLRAGLPGELRWERLKGGYDTYRDLVRRMAVDRHGFAVLPDYRAVQSRDADERWLVTARVDGEVVGAATYWIEEYAGALHTGHLLSTGPLGRALLLEFFARHVDQVSRVIATVAPDETPELWATDFAVRTEADVSFPGAPAPMARVLSVSALDGLTVGPGRVSIELVEDPFIAGRYTLDGTDGRLTVTEGSGAAATATLTAAGFSGLVYGVLDPVDVVIRGLGSVPGDAAAELRKLFPKGTPYLCAEF